MESIDRSLGRRSLLKLTAAATFHAATASRLVPAADAPRSKYGYVVGETTGEQVGDEVLAQGGNAIDAIVAAALAAAVAAPNQTGIGGYGMSAVLAYDGGSKIIAIDGNSTAPAAIRPDQFLPEASSQGKSSPKTAAVAMRGTGWLTAGVPGILAGLQLAIERCGTKRFDELVQPAIRLAREGFVVPASLATVIKGRREIFERDPGSRNLFLPNGQPVAAGERFKNPRLAELLTTLAQANSVDAFYRGEIGRQIAAEFQQNGGLVTADDMAAYQARVVEPLKMTWGNHVIHTAPLTAGGFSALQMLLFLQAMRWDRMPEGFRRTHAQVEAMRWAWRDRLTLLGDPEHATVPVDKLLSKEYAKEVAEKILRVVDERKLISHRVTPHWQSGTVHLSAVDRHGNFAALTLTHGEAFGACVTVDAFGLTLGHGMTRFDPNPDHPNAPRPGKRPLHNMVPTVVTRDDKPVLAVGGAGGRRIPNGLLEILAQFVAQKRTFHDSMTAPRLHTEGSGALSFEKDWPEADLDQLRQVGYSVSTAGSARMSAVALERDELYKSRR